jgi:ABC-type multidrug transport system fused ATPase/permease subunit
MRAPVSCLQVWVGFLLLTLSAFVTANARAVAFLRLLTSSARQVCEGRACAVVTSASHAAPALFGMSAEVLHCSLRAPSLAEQLHTSMLDHVIRSPISFHDSNPAGRIINRFSKDLSFIDEVIPPTFFDVAHLASMLLGILVSVAIVSPWSLFFLAFFVAATARLRCVRPGLGFLVQRPRGTFSPRMFRRLPTPPSVHSPFL